MIRLTALLIAGTIACSSCRPHNVPERAFTKIDSTIVRFDSTIILGKTYRGLGTNENKLVVLNSGGDTILDQADMYFDFEFADFNGDSLDDIVVHRLTNVGGIKDLLLFDKARLNFTLVDGFERFPDPQKIPGTDYYYSYHRSGCADAFWDSDLFYLQDFKAILLANISGNECEGEKGIIVSKIVNGEKRTFEKHTLDVLDKYSDHKWGFIADYWSRNYYRFIQ
jgi:hypothetical protein